MFTNRKTPTGLEVLVFGGLGNQLFQAAAALRQANRIGCQVTLVPFATSPGDTPRSWELGFLSDQDQVQIGERPLLRRVFKERAFGFDPQLNRVRAGTRLEGYFQSWRYFEGVDVLSLLCRSEDFLSGRHDLSAKEFIAVHLRRGDYRLEPAKSFHGLFSDAYFVKAVSLLRQAVGDLPAIIFSDCLTSAMELKSKLPGSEVFMSTRDSSLYHLGALSMGHAFALSNSSFSWWGAFLSSMRDGLVVVPRPWFRYTAYQPHDLLWPAWMSLGDPADLGMPEG